MGVPFGEGAGISFVESSDGRYREGVSREPPGVTGWLVKRCGVRWSVWGVGKELGKGVSSVCQGSLRLAERDGVMKALVSVRGFLLGVSTRART